MSSVGYGDYYPRNDDEKIFGVFLEGVSELASYQICRIANEDLCGVYMKIGQTL